MKFRLLYSWILLASLWVPISIAGGGDSGLPGGAGTDFDLQGFVD
jgi:hypothetical protein